MLTVIQDVLYRLGITPTYVGFFYVAYGVMLTVEDNERLLAVTKILYPQIAEKYYTQPICVERNIRTVVRVAWSQNPELLMRLARRQLVAKPTAAQFIAILASHVER